MLNFWIKFIKSKCIRDNRHYFQKVNRKAIFNLLLLPGILIGITGCASIIDDCEITNAHPPLVVFGDSYSDTGNIAIEDIARLPPPYVKGRFSNGEVAVDHLANELGTVAKPSLHTIGCTSGYNYAVGGGNIRGSDRQDLSTQVNEYLDRVSSADPSVLYFVMMGGNDVRQMDVTLDTATATTTLNLILSDLLLQLQKLVDAGAQQLMVANNGDMGKLPSSLEDVTKAVKLTEYSTQYNSLLVTRLNQFIIDNPSLEPNKIKLFDLHGAMAEILLDPSSFGFINSTEACCLFRKTTLEA